MTASKTACGHRLIDSIRKNPNADEADARADIWRRYRVQLAHVACGRAQGHEGKCCWRYAMTWWAEGDPTREDPATDAMIGEQLRARLARRTELLAEALRREALTEFGDELVEPLASIVRDVLTGALGGLADDSAMVEVALKKE